VDGAQGGARTLGGLEEVREPSEDLVGSIARRWCTSSRIFGRLKWRRVGTLPFVSAGTYGSTAGEAQETLEATMEALAMQ
jgi:hypothetical protein